MKVKTNPEFSPISIILESQEELEALWHLTNIGYSNSLDCYSTPDEPGKLANPPKENIRNFKRELWDELDEIVRPEEHE